MCESDTSRRKESPGMVQAWVAPKLVKVTFYKFFDVTFYKYLKRLLVKIRHRKRVV